MKDGLLLIDKEAGCTSHDVVQQVRQVVRQKKVGHCGTLDPDATGLLLLTLGKATRLTRFLIRAPKVYTGILRLGVATDTHDAAGSVTEERPVEGITRKAVEEAMEGFVGSIEQSPPPYSAKKVKGVKHYELARRGEEVPETTKQVTVFDFSAEGDLEDGAIAFRLACSSGTYARTLAHDLGQTLGTGGHLARLSRLRIGGFSVDDAIAVGELARRLEAARDADEGDEETTARLGTGWVPFDEIPLPFDEVITDPQQERRLSHGQTVLLRELSGDEGDWVKLLSPQRRFIAVGTVIETIGEKGVGIVQPRVVFK